MSSAKNPNESTKQLLELIIKFRKVVGYKTNIQKLIVSYASSNHLENQIV